MQPARSHLVLVASIACAACDPPSPPAAGSGSAVAVASGTATATPPHPPASVTAAVSASASAVTSTPSRPLYYEAPITPADLEGRSLRELALMRNTIFARAGNPFRRPWLDAYFRAQPWYKPGEKWDESKISKLDKQNARTIADHDASLTHEALEKWAAPLLEKKKAGTLTKDDEIELALLSQRLGKWLGTSESGGEPSPLEDPSRLDKLLVVEDLAALSRRDLRMLRNTIYARKGRAFDSAIVRAYFKSVSWYKPRADYHDGFLSELDRKNIAIVRSVEASLGGPEHENPDYGKDGWFVAA